MDYQSWLPQGALFDGVLLRHFDAGLELWAEKWFKNAPEFHCIFKPASNNRVLENGCYWQTEDEQLSCVLSSSGSNMFAANLLDTELPDKPVSEVDGKLLTSIVSGCFKDLLEIITGLLEVDTKLVEMDSIQSVGDGYGELIIKSNTGELIANINISLEAMFEYRRSGLEDRVPAFGNKQREHAVSQQSIALGAFVGNSRINLGDLENLAVGDVMVLDKSVGDAMVMTINSRVTPGIECGIVQGDNQISLKITKFNIEE